MSVKEIFEIIGMMLWEFIKMIPFAIICLFYSLGVIFLFPIMFIHWLLTGMKSGGDCEYLGTPSDLHGD